MYDKPLPLIDSNHTTAMKDLWNLFYITAVDLWVDDSTGLPIQPLGWTEIFKGNRAIYVRSRTLQYVNAPDRLYWKGYNT